MEWPTVTKKHQIAASYKTLTKAKSKAKLPSSKLKGQFYPNSKQLLKSDSNFKGSVIKNAKNTKTENPKHSENRGFENNFKNQIPSNLKYFGQLPVETRPKQQTPKTDLEKWP